MFIRMSRLQCRCKVDANRFRSVWPGIPCLGDAKIGGKVEIDFQGQFATRNKPGVLLRHCYVEAKDDDFRLLVGQTWDVISPLAIPTLNYTAGSAVGNLAYRRAQFRAERYFAFSDVTMLTAQGSVNAKRCDRLRQPRAHDLGRSGPLSRLPRSRRPSPWAAVSVRMPLRSFLVSADISASRTSTFAPA